MNFIVNAILSVIAGVMVIGLIMSFPIYLLWNGCLIDAVDGVHKITWLQAWGLMALFSMLFKTSVSRS